MELYDSSLTEWSENNDIDCIESLLKTTDSKSVKEDCTIVPKTPLKSSYNGENGTIVSDFEAVDITVNSNNHCIKNNNIEIAEAIEIAEDPQPVQVAEAGASTPSADLTERPDEKFSTDPQDYLTCHPFIYQFFRYCQHQLATGQITSSVMDTLARSGLLGFDNQEILHRFVARYGHAILEQYNRNIPVPVQPLTRADIDHAILTSREYFS